MVDLSVVIPVYNGAALLPRCLDAIVAQQTHYEMEVWLVDDGSTDFVVISNNRKSDFVKQLDEFIAKGHSVKLIIPEFKEVDITPYEDDKEKIVKWVVEND